MSMRTLRNLILYAALAVVIAAALAPPAPAAPAIQLFSNNAVTTLSAPITSTSATSLTVSSSSAFPSISGGNWFIVTLQHLVSGVVTAQEIVQVTADPSNTWTIVRGQEGTSPQTWLAGDTVALLPTAGGLGQFVQPGLDQADGYNFAADSGTANVYSATFNPAIGVHVDGSPLRVRILNTNTGPSTFNDGAGAASVLMPTGNALRGGELQAGQIATFSWNAVGNFFQLLQGAWQQASDAVITDPAGGGEQVISGSMAIQVPVAQFPLDMINTSATTNNGRWGWNFGPTAIALSACTDSRGSCGTIFNSVRSSGTSTITQVNLGGTSQTGTTQAFGDTSTNFATTAHVKNVLLNGPTLGGGPTVNGITTGPAMTVNAGTNWNSITANGSLQVIGPSISHANQNIGVTQLLLHGGFAEQVSINSAAPADQKVWSFVANPDGSYSFRSENDALSATSTWMKVIRNGTFNGAQATVQFFGQAAGDSNVTVADTFTANTYSLAVYGGNTAGFSNGLRVAGGTGTLDNAYTVTNAANSATFMNIRGDGQTQFPQVGTTASSANAFLDNTNFNALLRSTSSIRYKTDVRDVLSATSELMKLRPVRFKSLATADDPKADWLGFIAEEVAKVDSSLIVRTADGKPDGVQYDRVSALEVPVVQRLRREVWILEASSILLALLLLRSMLAHRSLVRRVAALEAPTKR